MTMIMAARSDTHHRLARAATLVGAAVLCALSLPAMADVRIVDSGPGTVVVEARDATVEQVLEALSKSRNFEFHASGALTRVLSATYSGTLPRVLGRILDGYDHVVQSTPSGIRVNVVGVAQALPSVSKLLATPAAMSGTMAVNIGRRVSTNVDQDEENAQAAQAGVPAAKPVMPSRPGANSSPPVPAALTGNARGTAGPRVSTNVDLDEETSR
jgi:hypothetical protein